MIYLVGMQITPLNEFSQAVINNYFKKTIKLDNILGFKDIPYSDAMTLKLIQENPDYMMNIEEALNDLRRRYNLEDRVKKDDENPI